MRVLGHFIAFALALARSAQVTPSLASVYSFNSGLHSSYNNPSPPSLSPDTARLVFAQQLGLSRYHDLHTSDEASLRLLNQFNGKQAALLPSHDENGSGAGKLLVVVEGIQDANEIFSGSIADPAFTIKNPPPSAANAQLCTELLMQEERRRGSNKKCSNRYTGKNGVAGGYIQGSRDINGCAFSGYLDAALGASEDDSRKMTIENFATYMQTARRYGFDMADTMAIFHIEIPAIVAREDGIGSKRYKEMIATLKGALLTLGEGPPGLQSTVVFMPLDRKGAKHIGSYGPYEVSKARVSARQEKVEEPLEVHSALSSPNVQENQSQSLMYKDLPKVTQLPLCHPDKTTCETVTNSCMGHGECILKYTTKQGGEDSKKKSADCFACLCNKPTVVSSGSGKKTTNYGGAACQKKDISAPFFLIAGATIFLVAIVSWGIGLMFSIGQEDLPSVIGAGVAGPKVQT